MVVGQAASYIPVTCTTCVTPVRAKVSAMIDLGSAFQVIVAFPWMVCGLVRRPHR